MIAFPRVMKNSTLFLLIMMLLASCSNQQHPFTLLDNKIAGVDFVNTLTYTEDINAYLFRGFYNGAGVALADLNNDGYPDLFLCGNQVQNKLYLGDGKFHFTDITNQCGIAGAPSWTTGVSIVDINQDGWKDIYVCKSGPLNGANRRNQLFINKGVDSNGNISFIDSAAQYGIDDLGFSIQAVFFDYDKDGDLDMYLSSNSPQQSDIVFTADKDMRNRKGGGSKLYKNINHHFVDVTEEAGIHNSPIGFGLGVAVGDINRDGWPDLYVANDFFEKDYLYINQKNGTFKEEIDDLTNEISMGSMGVDIGDLNHDGYPEIFVTEMLPEEEDRLKTKAIFDNWDQYQLKVKNGYHRQFPRNTLQLNVGHNQNDSSVHFSEISRYAGVAASDWSWGAQMIDVDNDGQKEIFVTNGIGKDLLDRDFLSYYDDPQRLKQMLKSKGMLLAELFDKMPSKPIANCLFKMDSDFVFTNASKDFGLDQPGFSSGAAYADIDNDGDLDLVVNNINAAPFIYRNELKRDSTKNYISLKLLNNKNCTATGAQVSLWAAGKLFYEEAYNVKGSMSVSDDRLLVGLGKATMIDSIEVHWPEGGTLMQKHINVNQSLVIRQKINDNVVPAHLFSTVAGAALLTPFSINTINYCHKETAFNDFTKDELLFQMYSNEGPKLAIGDVNGDGLDDFFVGNAKGQPGVIFQQTKNGFIKTNEAVFEKTKESEDQYALFFDADKDGDNDLIVASGSYEFANGALALSANLYINDGKGNFTISAQVLPIGNPSGTSVIIAADYDNDGDLDLFFGGRFIPGSYGVPASSYLLQNNGKGMFTNVTTNIAPGLLNIGMVTSAVWSDYDKDGDMDLIIAGEWMPIKIFANDKGHFSEVNTAMPANTNGFWNTIQKADLDNDGDDDYIIGNMGRNTFFTASEQQPVEMYVNDFGRTGKVKQVITTYRKGKSYPIAMKDVISKHIPSIQKKFIAFADYQGKQVEDIFSKEELQSAIHLDVYQTASCILWNDAGKFSIQPLPWNAQLSPVYAIIAEDINGDGLKDILLGGNQYNAQPQTGIYAGSYGTTLINKGNRTFKAATTQQAGFFVKGQVRDIQAIKYKNEKLLLVAKNNDSLSIFKIGKQ